MQLAKLVGLKNQVATRQAEFDKKVTALTTDVSGNQSTSWQHLTAEAVHTVPNKFQSLIDQIHERKAALEQHKSVCLGRMRGQTSPPAATTPSPPASSSLADMNTNDLTTATAAESIAPTTVPPQSPKFLSRSAASRPVRMLQSNRRDSDTLTPRRQSSTQPDSTSHAHHTTATTSTSTTSVPSGSTSDTLAKTHTHAPAFAHGQYDTEQGGPCVIAFKNIDSQTLGRLFQVLGASAGSVAEYTLLGEPRLDVSCVSGGEVIAGEYGTAHPTDADTTIFFDVDVGGAVHHLSGCTHGKEQRLSEERPRFNNVTAL